MHSALVLSFLVLTLSPLAMAKGRAAASSRGLASSLGGGAGKPLEVRGQSRNLSMLQTTQAEKDQINFVKRRTSYRHEIKTTSY